VLTYRPLSVRVEPVEKVTWEKCQKKEVNRL